MTTTGTEDQASAECSPSPQTPHPQTTQAPARGIKFPISGPGRVRQKAQDGVSPDGVVIPKAEMTEAPGLIAGGLMSYGNETVLTYLPPRDSRGRKDG